MMKALFPLIFIGFATVAALDVSSVTDADVSEAVSSKLACSSLPRSHRSIEPLFSEDLEEHCLGESGSPTSITRHILMNGKTKDVLVEVRPTNCEVERQIAPFLVEAFKAVPSIVIGTAELRDDDELDPQLLGPQHPTLIYFCPAGGDESDIELYEGEHSPSSVIDFVIKKSYVSELSHVLIYVVLTWILVVLRFRNMSPSFPLCLRSTRIKWRIF